MYGITYQDKVCPDCIQNYLVGGFASAFFALVIKTLSRRYFNVRLFHVD
jgi:hypothetical protein